MVTFIVFQQGNIHKAWVGSIENTAIFSKLSPKIESPKIETAAAAGLKLVFLPSQSLLQDDEVDDDVHCLQSSTVALVKEEETK